MDNSTYCPCCSEIRYYENVHYCNKCSQILCRSCLVNDDLDKQWIHDYCIPYDGTKEMREEYGFNEGDYEIGEIIDDAGVLSKYCPYCNGLKVNDDMLLEFAMNELLNMNKEELKELYFKGRKNNEKCR